MCGTPGYEPKTLYITVREILDGAYTIEML